MSYIECKNCGHNHWVSEGLKKAQILTCWRCAPKEEKNKKKSPGFYGYMSVATNSPYVKNEDQKDLKDLLPPYPPLSPNEKKAEEEIQDLRKIVLLQGKILLQYFDGFAVREDLEDLRKELKNARS